jgi:hypothetical protein
VGNHKRRLERLEKGRKGNGVYIMIVGPGETKEEIMQRHLAQHPEDEEGVVTLILDVSGSGQDPPSAPPPPRPKTPESPKVPGPGPLQITR